MSGPYCKTCLYYRPYPIGLRDLGECSDPTKIIYKRGGDPNNGQPPVRDDFECRNHDDGQGPPTGQKGRT